MPEPPLQKSRWIAALLVAATATGYSASQNVQDLTSSEPTEEQLIEILTPKKDRNGLGRARKIDIEAPPRCTLKKSSGTRNIGLQPNSDVAAIQVQFAFNSAAILPEASRILDTLGRALTSQTLASSCFQIKGHTDNVGADVYNDQLSQERAAAVARYLATHFGIENDRLDARGFGEHHPFADNSTEEGRSKNRRVEIVNVE